MTSISKSRQLNRQRILPPPPVEQIPDASPLLLGSARPGKRHEHEKLIVKGQGTFTFKYHGDPVAEPLEPLNVTWRTAAGRAVLHLELDAERTRLFVDGQEVSGLPTGIKRDTYAYYWLSLSHNGWVRFGLGEERLETQQLAYALTPAQQQVCRQATIVTTSRSGWPMRVLRDPIVNEVALEVRGTDRLTMNDVAYGRFLPQAALPAACRQLYDTIAGPLFELDADDFPAFSQAIKYSIETPTGWCHQKLKDKQGDFGGPQEVYLRITLGQDGGESPGVPFVMEIWPPQCSSPVHQHAGANAVIRVLHGRIQVALFPYLRPNDPEPFGERIFEQGAITWISPLLNQVHRLHNPEPLGGEPCITIQCYQYDEADSGHYPYFDYAMHDDKLHQFEPDSDMDFVAFKERMRLEWQKRPNA